MNNGVSVKYIGYLPIYFWGVCPSAHQIGVPPRISESEERTGVDQRSHIWFTFFCSSSLSTLLLLLLFLFLFLLLLLMVCLLLLYVSFLL